MNTAFLHKLSNLWGRGEPASFAGNAVLPKLSNLCGRGELAIFTGAGISRDQPSNLPLWPDLVNGLLRDLAYKDPKRRYDQIVESLINRKIPSEVILEFMADYDETACKEAVASVFAGAAPNRHHHRLAMLAPKVGVFVTTNYDNCFEQALAAHDVVFKVLVTDADFLRGCEALTSHTLSIPVVAKIHGDIKESGGMVMMLNESRRGLSGAKRRFMNYLFRHKHVLFLGYSGGDLYLDDNRLLMRHTAPDARGFTWVFRPGATQSGAVDNLIELYNRDGRNRASSVELNLDDLLPVLVDESSASKEEIQLPQLGEPEPAREVHWPQTSVERQPGMIIAEMLMHAGDLDVAQQVLEGLPHRTENSQDEIIGLGAIASLARLAQRRGNHKQALKILAECSLQGIDLDDDALEHARASLRLISADSLMIMGRIDEALQATEEACNAFSKLGNYKSLLIALGNHSVSLMEKGKTTEARETLEYSLRLATQFGDVVSEAAAYNNLSLIHSQLGEYLLALENINKSISLDTSIGNLRGICRAYYNRGLALNYAGRLDDAFVTFQQGSELAERAGMLVDVGRAQNGMGTVEFNRGNHAEAAKHWIKALEISKQLGDFLGEMELLNNLAEVTRSAGKLEAALTLINDTIQRMEANGFTLCMGPYHHTRGLVYLDLQRYEKAEKDFLTAAMLFSKLGNTRAQAKDTYHAGIAAAMQKHFAVAVERFRSAEITQREINDRRALADTLLFRGKMSVALNHPDILVSCFEEAIDILTESGSFERAINARQELNYYLGIKD